MKQKISVTIDEHSVKIIENILNDGRFRNRSHVIEYSLRKFLDELNDLDDKVGVN